MGRAIEGYTWLAVSRCCYLLSNPYFPVMAALSGVRGRFCRLFSLVTERDVMYSPVLAALWLSLAVAFGGGLPDNEGLRAFSTDYFANVPAKPYTMPGKRRQIKRIACL
jgi:hypothetical protein